MRAGAVGAITVDHRPRRLPTALLVWGEVAEQRRCDRRIAGGWAGLYEVTPDHNALIGEAPQPARLLYATGFSGHGFLQGPAVGEVVRDLFVGRQPPVDVAPLAVDRFQQAKHTDPS